MTAPSICAALLFSFALAACASSVDPATADDANDGDNAAEEELIVSVDATALTNAKTFFEALVEQGTLRAASRIPYSKLPAKLGRAVARNNPHPKQEWAAEAYRTRVKDGIGHDVTIFGVIDGIDDEGETITLYTSSGRTIAEASDYRGFVWN